MELRKSAAATNVANGKVYELTKANMFKNPKGTISTAPAGRFLTAYMSGGGPSNTAFGWPTAKSECSLPGEGCALPVEKGVGLWSPNTGIVATETAIYDAWKPQAGALGYPSSAPKALGAGKTQVFPGGEAFSSSDGVSSSTMAPCWININQEAARRVRWFPNRILVMHR